MRFGRQKKHKPVSQDGGLTRRTLLRAGLSLAALGGAAYVGGKTLNSIGKARARYERKLFEAMNRKPVSTREKGVRGIIENTPEIVEKEMSWYKPGPGQLREGHFNRMEKQVDSVLPKRGDRSKLHTHPYHATTEVPEQLRRRFISNLSPGDVLSLIKLSQGENPIRTSHVAAVDTNGKVIGYVSYRLSRNLMKDERALSHLSTIAEHYDSIISNAIWNKNWGHLEKMMNEYSTRINDWFGKNGKMTKNGLLIHRTSMPGYEYKDGHFREKAK